MFVPFHQCRNRRKKWLGGNRLEVGGSTWKFKSKQSNLELDNMLNESHMIAKKGNDMQNYRNQNPLGNNPHLRNSF